MTLSVNAAPFFSCPRESTMIIREQFICTAKASLSRFDFSLICELLAEWESSSTLAILFKRWELSRVDNTSPVRSSLQILSFNVRGLELRLQEVLLLSNSHQFDILILLETGHFDLDFVGQVFSKYSCFYQQGENANGGVVVLVRNDMEGRRFGLDLPNVCVVDVKVNKRKDSPMLRVIGIYAPESKSWSWEDLSDSVTDRCALFGDFNVDIEKDSDKAEKLLKWSDSHFLSPNIAEGPTSLRSNRNIDYAFTTGCTTALQTYEGNTSSDHKPIIAFLPIEPSEVPKARNTHWNVFSLFCNYVYPSWEERWNMDRINDVYNDYTSFLSLLTARCTTWFSTDRYRSSIPPQLRAYMSHTRALSFRQKKTGDLELKEVVNERRRIGRRELKGFLSSYLSLALAERNSASTTASTFWSSTRRFMKAKASTLQGDS